MAVIVNSAMSRRQVLAGFPGLLGRVAAATGFSLPYVSLVWNGKRRSDAISAEIDAEMARCEEGKMRARQVRAASGWLSIPAAARQYNGFISERTLRRLAAKGELPSRKVGRCYDVCSVSLHRMMSRRRREESHNA